MRLFIWLVLSLALVATVPSPARGGSIEGTVRLKGPVPPAKKVPVTIDQYICGKEMDADDLVLSSQNGIQYAVVWLENPPATERAAAPATPTAVDQKECVFIPRVVVVPAGGSVDFLNSDRLLHNLHSVSTANPSFNRAQPKGRTIPVAFAQPEIVRIDCDLHSWMRGWVVVADHPFYAVSDAEGHFTLAGVPPGRYRLKVWQERLGTVSREIVVGEQPSTRVVVEMTGK